MTIKVVRTGICHLVNTGPGLEILGESATVAGTLARVAATDPNVTVLDVELPGGSAIELDASNVSVPVNDLGVTQLAVDSYFELLAVGRVMRCRGDQGGNAGGRIATLVPPGGLGEVSYMDTPPQGVSKPPLAHPSLASPTPQRALHPGAPSRCGFISSWSIVSTQGTICTTRRVPRWTSRVIPHI